MSRTTFNLNYLLSYCAAEIVHVWCPISTISEVSVFVCCRLLININFLLWYCMQSWANSHRQMGEGRGPPLSPLIGHPTQLPASSHEPPLHLLKSPLNPLIKANPHLYHVTQILQPPPTGAMLHEYFNLVYYLPTL